MLQIGEGIIGPEIKLSKKLPNINFDKQIGRSSIINEKQNPHELRFTNFNRFPDILSHNKR